MSILVHDTKTIEKLIRSINKWTNANEEQQKNIFKNINALYRWEQISFNCKYDEINSVEEVNFPNDKVNNFSLSDLTNDDFYSIVECIRLLDSLKYQIELDKCLEMTNKIVKNIEDYLLVTNDMNKQSAEFKKQYQSNCVW